MKISHLLVLSALSCSQIYAYNFPQHPTKTYECEECSKLSHETLHATWNIADVPLDTKVKNISKSYSYNQVVSAEQLSHGVLIPTRAPGAVVHITPLQKLPVPDLEMKTPENQSMSLKDAAALYSQNDSSNESLIDNKYLTTMQIKPQLGFGNFVIKSKLNHVNKDHRYLINVFDKYSLIALKIEPQALRYQYGDEFKAIISLKDTEYSYPLEDISAQLITPDEQSIPLKLSKIKRNQFKASATLLSELNTHGDNWYIEAEVSSEQNGSIVRRNGHAAFSYSIPSASLLDLKKVSFAPLTFTTTIEVATASRYALQSVLFRTDSSGKQIPIQISQKSQWLEPGTQTIKFNFDNSKYLEDDTLSVGYLQLTDYGQLKTVYQHNRPIKLSELTD